MSWREGGDIESSICLAAQSIRSVNECHMHKNAQKMRAFFCSMLKVLRPMRGSNIYRIQDTFDGMKEG